jgi:hypothetical protein
MALWIPMDSTNSTAPEGVVIEQLSHPQRRWCSGRCRQDAAVAGFGCGWNAVAGTLGHLLQMRGNLCWDNLETVTINDDMIYIYIIIYICTYNYLKHARHTLRHSQTRTKEADVLRSEVTLLFHNHIHKQSQTYCWFLDLNRRQVKWASFVITATLPGPWGHGWSLVTPKQWQFNPCIKILQILVGKGKQGFQ